MSELTASNFFISIGIVTWNSEEFLPSCLASLQRQIGVDFELTVVDNASTDKSLSIISTYFPQAQIIRNPSNKGFCYAHNQAIGISGGEYYLALNPDIQLAPDYTGTLVDALASRPDYGMAGGRLILESGGIDSSGLGIDRRRRQYLRGHGSTDLTQFSKSEEVFGIDGAAPLYRMAMLEDVREESGYFDEDFFAYKEDVDLAWRARWLGWRAWYDPEATAVHHRTFHPGTRAASPETRFLSVRNRYWLLLKNESPEGWRRDILPILFYDFQILGYLALRERESFRAFPAAYVLRERMRNKYKALMARAKVRPEEMLAWFL